MMGVFEEHETRREGQRGDDQYNEAQALGQGEPEPNTHSPPQNLNVMYCNVTIAGVKCGIGEDESGTDQFRRWKGDHHGISVVT